MPRPSKHRPEDPTQPTPPPGINRLHVAVALAVLTVLAIAALFTARPAWRAVKHFRAESFGRESQTLLAAEEWTLAMKAARAALQLNPNCPKALRSAAQLYSRLQTDTAFRYYDSLLTTPEATALDREDYAESALRLNATNIASLQLELLLESPEPSPRTRVLAAQLQHALGNAERALELAAAAVQAEPGNPTNVFILAALRNRSPRITDHEAARRLLWPFARTNGGFRLRALGSILLAPDAPRADREEILSLLQAIPEPSFEERVLLFEARANLNPSQTRSLADEAIRTLRPETERQLSLLAEWLVRHEFIQPALNQLAGQRVFRDRGLFLLLHRIYLGDGQTQKAYDLLFNPAAPLSPFELETLRCQAAAALANDRLRDEHLQHASTLAGVDVRNVTTVTQLASLCGNLDPALEAWRRILKVPRNAPLALRQLIRISEAQGDTAGARAYARQLVVAEPTNAPARLKVAQCSLLLGEDLETALQEVQLQLESNPSDPEIRSLLALAHLRQNDPLKAALASEGLLVGIVDPSPGVLTILAAVAAANDRVLEARRWLARIPLRGLKPEERELLRPLVAVESRLVNEPGSR